MKRRQKYLCPTCGATKEIHDLHGRNQFPATVPCGWRGCADVAVRT